MYGNSVRFLKVIERFSNFVRPEWYTLLILQFSCSASQVDVFQHWCGFSLSSYLPTSPSSLLLYHMRPMPHPFQIMNLLTVHPSQSCMSRHAPQHHVLKHPHFHTVSKPQENLYGFIVYVFMSAVLNLGFLHPLEVWDALCGHARHASFV